MSNDDDEGGARFKAGAGAGNFLTWAKSTTSPADDMRRYLDKIASAPSIIPHTFVPPPAVVHNAGPMVELVQKCTRCGCILEDYRNCAFAHGDGPGSGWAEGPVTRQGNMTSTGETVGAVRCGVLEA